MNLHTYFWPMLKKDNLFTGVLASLIFPALAWATEYLLKDTAYMINRPLAPYFIAIALNLILLRLGFRSGRDKTGRGIMLATFGFMVLLFIFKVHLFK
jgi:hypothetical protein